MEQTIKPIVTLMFLFTVLFIGSPSVQAESANPFGFDTLVHPREYEFCREEPKLSRGQDYICDSAPRSHPDILRYYIAFEEGVGLCKIVAESRAVNMHQIAGFYSETQIGSFDSFIEKLLIEFLNELSDSGLERDDDDVEHLAHLLAAYIASHPKHSTAYDSFAMTQQERTAILKEVFLEMKAKLGTDGKPNILMAWHRNLKNNIEEKIRSSPSNLFEAFHRQLTNKYGPSGLHEPGHGGQSGRGDKDIIKETTGEVLSRYRSGNPWNPAQGFAGHGDVKKISLYLASGSDGRDHVYVRFVLVTSEACKKAIDAAASRAF